MKIAEDRQDVLVGGAQSVDSFTIKASAKAFQILSSNLYSNPLGSMIRELSTNAYDAHIMVDKKDEPFELTLPNSLEPTFKIRDYGPGLSHDEIYQVYTTFFESTKTDSNDVVGCLGLGSKSPFGVADSFTITSFYNGIKTIYSAFLNDARIPSIAKFLEEDTSEENGLMIEVAIKEDDFYSFNREVNKQLKYFTVKPTIKGATDFQWNPDETYLYEASTWKMVKDGDGARVIQGQISYPISIHDMGKVYDNAPAAVQSILQRNVLFDVAIGDVNIAPSREALSYDDRTSENIVAAAEKILEELPDMITEAVVGCETLYDARLKYSDITQDLGRGYYGRNALEAYLEKSKNILWKGKSVASKEIKIPKDDIISATRFSKSYNGRFQKSNFSAYGSYNDPDKDKTWDFQASDLERTIWVYSTPQDKAVEGRSKQFTNDNYGRDVNLYVIKTTLTARKLANRFGIKTSQLVIAKDLEKVRRTSSGGSGGTKSTQKTVQKFDRQSYNKTDAWNNKTVEDLTELEGYYVRLDRFDVEKPNGSYETDLKSFVKGAIELGIIAEDDVVYGLRKNNQKKDHNLKCLFTTVEDSVKTLTLKGQYDWGQVNTDIVDKLRNEISDLRAMQNIILDTSPARAVIDALILAGEASYSYDAQKLIDKYNLKGSTTDMTAFTQVMHERYPMIAHTNYYFNREYISDYIVQMDALYECTAGNMPKAPKETV